MFNHAYQAGRAFEQEHYHCPCMGCLQSVFGYSETDAYFFRQGFYEAARDDGELDLVARIDPLNCPFCCGEALE